MNDIKKMQEQDGEKKIKRSRHTQNSSKTNKKERERKIK
jgi:hypothetical protein